MVCLSILIFELKIKLNFLALLLFCHLDFWFLHFSNSERIGSVSQFVLGVFHNVVDCSQEVFF